MLLRLGVDYIKAKCYYTWEFITFEDGYYI